MRFKNETNSIVPSPSYLEGQPQLRFDPKSVGIIEKQNFGELLMDVESCLTCKLSMCLISINNLLT